MRKRPMQARAQRTIQTIFEATAQIVDSEGLEALTTNKIAQKAGFSVGTLYQYFSSKEAVVQAMIVSERERVMAEMQAILVEVAQGKRDPQEALRLRIRTMIAAFGTGDRLSRSMVRLGWQMDHSDVVAQAQRESAERIAIAWEQVRHQGLRPLTPAVLFVCTRAVIGVIRSASLENSPLLGTQAFEDELVRMAWSAMKA